MSRKLKALFYLLLLGFVLQPAVVSMTNINFVVISQVFHNFAVGGGAILTGLAGLKYLNDFLEKRRRQF